MATNNATKPAFRCSECGWQAAKWVGRCGYELALACDEIILVDDRSSAVSLPEVPLLGVLPGTGGLTRVTDKRRVRHDLADIFCTSVEGVRGQREVTAWQNWIFNRPNAVGEKGALKVYGTGQKAGFDQTRV